MQSTSTILDKLFAQSEWTEEEAAWLLRHLGDQESPELIQLMQNRFNEDLFRVQPVNSALADRLLQLIHTRMQAEQPVIPVYRIHFLRTAWFRYAAILLLIAGAATFLYLNKQQHPEIAKTTTSATPADILPGGNRAMLTLSDGTTIVLDSAANGSLASQGNTNIIKLDAEKLAYEEGASANNKILYNTISTPKGGQYQVELPDGTKVWLNAASSIRFPAAFGKDRKVNVTGEVYMEVAQNKEKPFIVDVDGKSSVEVLGTSFNINSYNNEGSIKTTLLAGSVKVRTEKDAAMLKPGQQAQISAVQQTRPGMISIANDADVEKVVAWKNGLFNFDGLTLEEVMRQLERWYDIEVVYEQGIPQKKLIGKMTKGVTLNGLLIGLQELGIHSRLEGRKLTILPGESNR